MDKVGENARRAAVMLGYSGIGVVFASRAVMGVMALGGPGLGPGPGMPGAPACPPG